MQVSPDPIAVLIVDDDRRVRASLRSLLSASPGFTVVADESDPAAALEAARVGTTDVALVDLRLPDLRDGLTLLKRLTGELHIPVVAMSLDGALLSTAMETGASAFLDKASATEVLTSALRTAAEGPSGPAADKSPSRRLLTRGTRPDDSANGKHRSP